MLFNSFDFVFFFLIVTTLYYLLPFKFRWALLLLASCLFYMAFIPIYIFILIITILIDYFAGIYIEKSQTRLRRRALLTVSILSTCLVLCIFKYYNFIVVNYNEIAKFLHWNYRIGILKIILPIGLSFHTFQSLSYVIEVYRGHQKAEKDFGIYCLYVMYYPQLVAGPIERPQNLLHQFRRDVRFDWNVIGKGLRLMCMGYFMKLVVADRCSLYVNAVYNHVHSHSGITFIVATFFFAFQIYSDFAGYSLIAIGASQAMGIQLMTNFRTPYASRSLSEFWRRWHISLSTWFRDYLYVPLGGSHGSKLRTYRNLMITFLVSGLWHGANWTYVIWGGFHGLYLIVENAFTKGKKIKFPQVWIFAVVCFGWIFFRANTVQDSFFIVKSIFTHPGKLFIPGNQDVTAPIYALIGIAILLLLENRSRIATRLALPGRPAFPYLNMLFYISLALTIIYLGVFDGGQFIYFQF
ncbi:MAG TPA: MBOAT family O-acyltransferase [Puia sp.]|nr:MBOAT family O-acyltransferase [Puia sp.]